MLTSYLPDLLLTLQDRMKVSWLNSARSCLLPAGVLALTISLLLGVASTATTSCPISAFRWEQLFVTSLTTCPHSKGPTSFFIRCCSRNRALSFALSLCCFLRRSAILIDHSFMVTRLLPM